MNNIKIDQLIRSHRKTIGLQITHDARLIVRAPFFTSETYIQSLINRKESWIKSKQEYFKQRQSAAKSKEFIPGEEYLYLGESYPLIVRDDLPKAVLFDGSLIISTMAIGNAQDHLENWYRTQALEYITQRVKHYTQMTGLKYQSLKVNAATTRWGSCGYNNSLNFSWRLIMTPARVIDYVVIHELMHIKQKNHSHKFWAEVAQMMPDYKQEERWLKQNSHLLRWP